MADSIPGISTRLAPNRVTSRAVIPDDSVATITARGRKARPVRTGE